MAWATTFYYGQELRSVYMNNIVNGLIKPGLYNIDAAVYTIPNDTSGTTAGVWLRLKAGATLVFTDGYDTGTGGVMLRNLDKLGSYVVKCVLQDDSDFLLSAPDAGSGVFLNHGTYAPVMFVYASFNYNKDAVGGMSPDFSLAVPSSNPHVSFDTTHKLPNEGKSTGTSPNISYLILGALLDNNQTPPSPAYSSAAGGWYDGGETAWLNNHVFTGRGFPDYRSSMFKTTDVRVPSIAFAPAYKNMYLTSGQFYFGSNIYNIPGTSWKVLYGQDSTVVLPAPTTQTGCITNAAISARGSSTYTVTAPTLTANKLLIEVLFLALETEYSHISYNPDGSISPLDLSGLLTSNTFALGKKLLPYSLVCDKGGTTEWDTSLMRAYYSLDYSVIPLDIGIGNQTRLRSFLANRNIILPIIDKIRQEGITASPFLEPSIGDSLLPVLLSVREVNSAGTNFTDIASSVATAAVNPANVISFFELQASTFAVTAVSLAAEETYTTLPFLD